MSTGSKRFSRTALALIAVVAAGLVVLAVAVAGGGGGGAYGGSPSSATAPSSGGGGPSVKLATTKLGKVLVDARGRTLYLFEADKGPKSACGGACASVWPPLTSTGRPTAGPGVTASKLGTTKRSDGGMGGEDEGN
jgi:predicted lipoprotein with Yx(FWY)xxD motif